MSHILEVRDLTYHYDGTGPFTSDAVSGVSFTVDTGEIVGIIGHTGSGKSTLVQQLNGLLKPTNGCVLFEGKDIWENPKNIKLIRSQVGLVFQYPEYQLFEETVEKDIAFGPKNMGISGEELDNRVKEICSVLKIPEEHLQKSPFELSGGEKRRVAIAGVMAMRPRVLVLDEPVAGLDPVGRADVISMIKTYRDTYNAAVIIVSHNMEDMAVLADRLIVMNQGEMALCDKTEAVFLKPEILRSAGLNVPIVTQVFETLRSKGYNVPQNILTVEAATRYLSSRRKGGNGNA